MSMIKRAIFAAAACFGVGTVGVSAEETCGGLYRVKSGDSLSMIADRLYKDVGQWSAIYRTNLEVIPSPDAIRVGQTYRMPCINGLPTGLEGGTPLAEVTAPQRTAPTQVQAQRARAEAERRQGVDVRLLAGDDFKPFTNRLQMSSGMITDLVNRAFVANDDTGQHKFYWINDRSVHLDPMLSEGMVDLAFPWRKPDCAAHPDSTLCTDFVYSEPMFEMLVVLFTAKGSGVRYTSEGDLDGLRICSPLGHTTATRQGGSAGYLAQAGARLQQPASAEDCFMRLVSGQADGVAMNEFTGRVVLKEMGLKDAVELQLSRPLAIESLHAVAHRNNPRAEDLIAAFDDGLATLRDNGAYLKVIDTHMSSIWAGL
ncbi:polar amino acid transport system substrate-binding protein [Sagittula marina]|uniref:Polar amino acid transport system substrate-binding protein n=2 Tax=Sagittula marina TaxID=943940 RepID=A0A7W6GRU3_9RHOB|nr:polar amino acid transport system substrate-binding protein [Sagittula marina]